MTRKELIKILKRFPKTAKVVMLNHDEPTIRAQVDDGGNWTIIIEMIKNIEDKKVIENSQNNSCQNENN